MDLSRLPKFSSGKPIPPAPEPGPPPPPPAGPTSPAGSDVYISIGIGALFLLMYPRFIQWACHAVFGTHFDPFIDPGTGAVVPYPKTGAFWGDLGPTVFGVTAVLDGVLLLVFPQRHMAAIVSLVLLGGSVAYNLAYAIGTYRSGGLAIGSAVAVLVGGMSFAARWRSLLPNRQPVP